MPAGIPSARDGLVRLRRRIAEIEGRGVLLNQAPRSQSALEAAAMPPALSPRRGGTFLPFDIPRLDNLMGGGLRLNALHEIRTEASSDGAATGFAAALAARLAGQDDRPLVWIIQAMAGREAGHLYGAGLDRFGLPSRRVILVGVRKPSEALWVFEEALRCRGLAGVLAEIRRHPRLLDLTASRRLALRARESGVMGLLLRQAAQADPGAALTRWLVTSRPAGILGGYPAGIGRPAWHLILERNRRGATGAIDLEWDHEARTFAEIDTATATHSRPVAPPSVLRPPSPSGAGTVVAFRDAS